MARRRDCPTCNHPCALDDIMLDGECCVMCPDDAFNAVKARRDKERLTANTERENGKVTK